MIIPINDHVEIGSDPLNWIIRTRATSKSTGKLTGWDNKYFYGLGTAGGLREALDRLTRRKCLNHPLPHPSELEPLSRVVERLELVERRIFNEYATPRRIRELAALAITVEAAGYRFVLNDPYCVQRQVPIRGGTWQSRQYFNTLGLALVDTFYRIIRTSSVEGLHAALQTIHQTEMAVRVALKQLPAAYFSAEAGSPPAADRDYPQTPGVTPALEGFGASKEDEVVST